MNEWLIDWLTDWLIDWLVDRAKRHFRLKKTIYDNYKQCQCMTGYGDCINSQHLTKPLRGNKCTSLNIVSAKRREPNLIDAITPPNYISLKWKENSRVKGHTHQKIGLCSSCWPSGPIFEFVKYCSIQSWHCTPVKTSFNSVRPSDANFKPSLVQIIAYRLVVAMPLSEPMLAYCWSEP